ncbi:hypothetical protein [Moorena bouillonii]|nr:hypothetical protein [Moorena bouillonii]
MGRWGDREMGRWGDGEMGFIILMRLMQVSYPESGVESSRVR